MKIGDVLIILAVNLISVLALWYGAGLKSIYQNYDGPYYAVVAKTWYDKELIRKKFSFPLPLEYYPAHFPLYPALAAAFSVLGTNLIQSMLAVNIIASSASSLLIYKIFGELRLGNALLAALTWLFFWPRMWAIRSIGSPETLFVLFVLASLFLFSKRRYWLSALMGCLAVLTKPPGILLLIGYLAWAVWERLRAGKLRIEIWPVGLIGLTLVGLFTFFYFKTGDFWAYFHSGDNLHLSFIPFRVFDADVPWVGDWWLEDILWIYFVGAVGSILAFKKSSVLGSFGLVFLLSILFVSHRDISRYSLPLVPVVLVGLSDLLRVKPVKWALVAMIVPVFIYSLNFVSHNLVPISDWTPFL